MSRPEVIEFSTRVVVIVLIMTAVMVIWACAGRKKIDVDHSVVIHPEWSRNSVIYEVNIRQFTPEGTFKAFEQHLNRLHEMGVDILWLMPINPIGLKNRKGTLGSYYSVKDYLAVDPEYGTLDDVRSLVKKAHELGMKVIIDWVANHTAWDNKLITEHPEWYSKDSAGNIKAPVPDWTDVADLNYDQQGLREYMQNALEYWVKEADIDGYRCDVAGMLPVDFWNKAVPEVKKIKHVFMLAEWETPEMHDTAFDMTYSWELYKTMNAIAKGEKTANQIDTILKKEAAVYTSDAYRMRFTSNHDENSWAGTEYERMGDAAQACAVLTFTLPGMPLIYSGQESAFNKRLSFFEKDTIDWDNYKLVPFYQALIRLKKDNEALWNGTAGGTLSKVKTNQEKEIYAFIREKNKSKVFVIVNMTAHQQTADLHDHNFIGDFKNIFTGESVRFEDVALMSLKAWEYRVYVKQ